MICHRLTTFLGVCSSRHCQNILMLTPSYRGQVIVKLFWYRMRVRSLSVDASKNTSMQPTLYDADVDNYTY